MRSVRRGIAASCEWRIFKANTLGFEQSESFLSSQHARCISRVYSIGWSSKSFSLLLLRRSSVGKVLYSDDEVKHNLSRQPSITGLPAPFECRNETNHSSFDLWRRIEVGNDKYLCLASLFVLYRRWHVVTHLHRYLIRMIDTFLLSVSRLILSRSCAHVRSIGWRLAPVHLSLDLEQRQINDFLNKYLQRLDFDLS